MYFKNLTFNDLPTVVGELCKRIESLETILKNSLAVQNKVKGNCIEKQSGSPKQGQREPSRSYDGG